MLIIEDNSVYEIDEECIRKRKVSKNCGTYEKVIKEQEKGIYGRQVEKTDMRQNGK